MLRFYAERWLSISLILQQMPQAHLLVAQDRGDTAGLVERIQNLRGTLIDLLEEEAKIFPFSNAISGQIARFCEELRRADLKSNAHINVLQALGGELALNVMSEFKSQLFVLVQPQRRHLFEQNVSPFGTEVDATFPDSTRDIAAAARCYALEEWTACVFHSMRVLEHGLRAMATRFSVLFTIDSWHRVITGIEVGLTGLRNKPGLTDQDRNEITYYSDAAAQFRAHFKSS